MPVAGDRLQMRQKMVNVTKEKDAQKARCAGLLSTVQAVSGRDVVSPEVRLPGSQGHLHLMPCSLASFSFLGFTEIESVL